MSLSTGAAYTSFFLEAGQPETAEVESSGEPAKLAVGELLCGADRLVGGGQNHVLKELDVFGIDRVRIDPDLLDLEVPRDLDRHHASSGGGFHDLVLELLLRLRHVGLHLLDLLEHLV